MTFSSSSLANRTQQPPQLHVADAAEQGLWLDRLADGELSDEQRRAVLLQLDELPGGWRNCAMAFLQAQVLTQDLRSAFCSSGAAGANGEPPQVIVVAASCQEVEAAQRQGEAALRSSLAAGIAHSNGASSPGSAHGPGSTNGIAAPKAAITSSKAIASAAKPMPAGHALARDAEKRRKMLRRWAGHAGIVACFVVAFGLGIVLRHAWDGGSSGDTLAGGGMDGPDLQPLVNKGSMPSDIGIPVGIPGQSGVPGQVARDGMIPRGQQSEIPSGTLKMVVNQGDEKSAPAELEVPVLSGPALSAWLKTQKPVVTRQLAEALRNKGHRVDVWAEYLPIVLEDGRTVLVPLELVEVELRNIQDYQ